MRVYKGFSLANDLEFAKRFSNDVLLTGNGSESVLANANGTTLLSMYQGLLRNLTCYFGSENSKNYIK